MMCFFVFYFRIFKLWILFHLKFSFRRYDATAIENVAENDFDRGGGSDNVVNATRFFEILFMQKTKSKTDVSPSLMSFWVMVLARAVVRTRALRLSRRCVRGRHGAGKGERWIKFQSHLRKVCPTDDAGFVRMSLKTLAMWLMDMSRTRSPHCRLYHIPLKVDGRRTVGVDEYEVVDDVKTIGSF